MLFGVCSCKFEVKYDRDVCGAAESIVLSNALSMYATASATPPGVLVKQIIGLHILGMFHQAVHDNPTHYPNKPRCRHAKSDDDNDDEHAKT